MRSVKKKKSRRRLKGELLIDRAAILLVVAKNRHDGDWSPWWLDRMYDDPESIGDEIRQWSDYKVARRMVIRWLKNLDRDLDEQERLEQMDAEWRDRVQREGEDEGSEVDGQRGQHGDVSAADERGRGETA